MAEETRQGMRDYFTNTTQYNQLRFIIQQTIKEMVNTASLVRIDSCTGTGSGGPAGTVSATPLVANSDALGNSLPMVSIPRLPYTRYQGGIAAIIIDPVPGDQGVAVFCKQDSSTVGVGTSESQRAGSNRTFDQSDGMIVGTVQNKAPEVWIELKQDKTIIIHAPEGVKIETDKVCQVDAGTQIKLTAPQIQLNGAISMQSKTGGATTATLTGTLNATNDLTANGVSLHEHTHSGVEHGGDSSGKPN